jgi:hypothetical protein
MSQSLWVFGLHTMFAFAGRPATAKIDGVTFPFVGILDRVQVEEENETGRYVRNESVLKVQKDVALKFMGRSLIPVSLDDTSYVISETKFEDDGETAMCFIIPVDENGGQC